MSLVPRVPMSVLDLVPVGEGGDATGAVQASLALARRADQLGFTRYWLAEHHNMPGIASSAPAVMIGAVAAATTDIRVGSGGVMLPNHAPLVVAEQFGTLAALHPGRIDLGLGRAPGHRPVHRRCAPAGREPGGRRVPRAAGPTRLLPRRRVARRSSVPRDQRRAPRGATAGDLVARFQPVQRGTGRPARACRSRSHTTSVRPTRCPRSPATARASGLGRTGRAVRDAHGAGDLRADRRRGRPDRVAGGAVVPAAARRAGPARCRHRRPQPPTPGRHGNVRSSSSAAKGRRSAVRRPSRRCWRSCSTRPARTS